MECYRARLRLEGERDDGEKEDDLITAFRCELRASLLVATAKGTAEMLAVAGRPFRKGGAQGSGALPGALAPAARDAMDGAQDTADSDATATVTATASSILSWTVTATAATAHRAAATKQTATATPRTLPTAAEHAAAASAAAARLAAERVVAYCEAAERARRGGRVPNAAGRGGSLVRSGSDSRSPSTVRATQVPDIEGDSVTSQPHSAQPRGTRSSPRHDTAHNNSLQFLAIFFSNF